MSSAIKIKQLKKPKIFAKRDRTDSSTKRALISSSGDTSPEFEFQTMDNSAIDNNQIELGQTNLRSNNNNNNDVIIDIHSNNDNDNNNNNNTEENDVEEEEVMSTSPISNPSDMMDLADIEENDGNNIQTQIHDKLSNQKKHKTSVKIKKLKAKDGSKSEMLTTEKSGLASEYKCITWNLWCIPVGSPRALSNPERCGNYLKDIAIREKWDEYDGLIFAGIQELWGWKTGIFPPFVLRIIALFEYIPYFGRVISAIFQILSLLFGVLPILKCLPIKYCPKQRFYNKVRRWLPHALCKTSIPLRTALDSGLLLLSSIPPKKWGFESFEECTCDDSMADKGFLYAWFDKQKLMVINTHLQAAGQGRERIEQLKQLRRFLDKWRQRAKFDRICILGDFNSDMTSHQERMRIWLEQQQKIDLTTVDENDESKDDNKENNSENNHNNNNKLHKIPKSGVHVDIKNIQDPRHASSDIIDNVELQMQDEHKYGTNDPLSLMSYSDLPPNLIPPEVREVAGHRTQLIRKGYINIPYHLGPKFSKINTFDPTYKRADYNIDHIFVNFQYQVMRNELKATKKGLLSDHRMIMTDIKIN